MTQFRKSLRIYIVKIDAKKKKALGYRNDSGNKCEADHRTNEKLDPLKTSHIFSIGGKLKGTLSFKYIILYIIGIFKICIA